MRFTMTKEGVERLATEDPPVILDAGKVCREFTGPSVREGLLGGFPKWILDWGKRALKVTDTRNMDVIDARLLYYVLAMRKVDHTALPIDNFKYLALTDFELVQHVVPFLDRDGDCGECSMDLDHPVHLDPEPAVELPPTKVPAGPGMTGTESG